MGKKRCTAILLAGGSGKRMGSDVPKQFLELCGFPVLYYSLMAIEKSEIIDDCILVASKEHFAYIRKNLLEKYEFTKVLGLAEGGRERWESVIHGIEYLEEISSSCDIGQGITDYIFIHDGARPFLDETILKNCYEKVLQTNACVCGMPSKDTVKITDDSGVVIDTPPRKNVWIVQTPQVFAASLIREAYGKLKEEAEAGKEIAVTDDAGVVEKYMKVPVSMVEASYQNIKLTTPEDMQVAASFLK